MKRLPFTSHCLHALSVVSSWQAIDRVHRLGQQKQVVVYRFLMTNSIDERILMLQKQKSEQVLLTFERSAEEARRQRIRDFKVLLS